jgi:hypothetical protein
MEEKNQKIIIYGGVGLAMAIIISFWFANLDFILRGGFRGKDAESDNSWQTIRETLGETVSGVKTKIEDLKSAPATTTVGNEELINLMKEKLESMVTGTTGTVR